MKKLIRNGVFETNSSSSHSITIAGNKKDFVLDTIYPDNDGNISIPCNEFYWDFNKYNDAITKISFVAEDSKDNESLRETLINVIKEQTGANNIIFDCDNINNIDEQYIDHESRGISPTNKHILKNFIFNKNSWLFTGNDNRDADDGFYNVKIYTNEIQ